MANFGKLSRTKLPPPPPPSEVTNNLSQPEHANYVDGRSLRATGRTTQFTTRITEELQTEIKVYAAQERMKLNELLEEAFIALKEKRERASKEKLVK
jgi:hypothetical protein